MKRNRLILLALVLALCFGNVAYAGLSEVSPTIDPQSHFPDWYKDANGLTLSLCLDGDGETGFCLYDPPIPDNELSQQTGFGAEAFYFMADAKMTVPNGLGDKDGDAILVIGLEAAYALDAPVPDTQIVFARYRLRIDTPVAGTYTVTHPYGVEVYRNVPAGNRAINDTQDIGVCPLTFTGALAGKIGPFVQWTAPDFPVIDPITGNQYIGDPQREHAVTGSPFGTNFFRVEAKDNLGNPIDLNGAAPGFALETDQFTVLGKIFDAGQPPIPPPPPPPGGTTPLTVERATIHSVGRSVRIEVFAKSASDATVMVAGINQPLTPDPAVPGSFFGRFSAPDVVPASITITAEAPGQTLTTVVAPLTDVLTATAKYNSRNGVLNIRVASTASRNNPPTLEAFDQTGKSLGVLSRNRLTVKGMTAPPATVTIKSSGKGEVTVYTSIQ